MIKVDNAIIMAAGLSSRFVPVSFDRPKALTIVKGEVLIERMIRQLREAEIENIIVITGYKSEMFSYLADKYSVLIVNNPEYSYRNNYSSLYYAKEYLLNSYICSADNYYTINPFSRFEDRPYYSAIYSDHWIEEWFISTDDIDRIINLEVGGKQAWYMIGHAFFDMKFSHLLLELIRKFYDDEAKRDWLWERFYWENLNILEMYIRKFSPNSIYEFDSIEELRLFDTHFSLIDNSDVAARLCNVLNCNEEQIFAFEPLMENGLITGMSFNYDNNHYRFYPTTNTVVSL